jgi:formamidopyrimidine-DNA glycosylase
VPELPEVETVVRLIRPLIIRRRILKSRFLIPRQLGPQTRAFVQRSLRNQSIAGVERKGKYILIHLERGVLLIHLRMTGRLYVRNDGKDADKHERAFFHLDDGHVLVFRDARTGNDFVLR